MGDRTPVWWSIREWGSVPKLVLAAAIVCHLLLLALSLENGLNPLFNDSTHRLGRGEDFFCFYQAGRNALMGESIYRDLERTYVVPYWGASGFRYLPIFAYTYGMLFNALEPWSAYAAWVVILECLLLFDVFLTLRHSTAEKPLVRAVAASMWLLFFPLFLELYMGQASFFVGSLLFLMALAFEEKRPGVFDGAWVVSGLTKMNAAILLPLMIRLKRWKGIAVLALAGGLSSALYFLHQPDDLEIFVSFNFGNNLLSTLHAGHFGLRALLLDLSTGFGVFGDHGQTVTWAISGTFVAISLLATVFSGRDKTIDVMALWISTYFLVYKDVWEHHYTMLLPFVVLAFLRSPSWKILCLYAVLALPTPFYFFDVPGRIDPQNFWNRWVSLGYHSFKIVPTILFYLVLCARIFERAAVRRVAGAAACLLLVSVVAVPLWNVREIRALGRADSSRLFYEGIKLERRGEVASARRKYLEALRISPGSQLVRHRLKRLRGRPSAP